MVLIDTFSAVPGLQSKIRGPPSEEAPSNPINIRRTRYVLG
jgi:hypothetical protein